MNRKEIERLLLHVAEDADENQHNLLTLELKLDALLEYLELEIVESNPLRKCPFVARSTKWNDRREHLTER